MFSFAKRFGSYPTTVTMEKVLGKSSPPPASLSETGELQHTVSAQPTVDSMHREASLFYNCTFQQRAELGLVKHATNEQRPSSETTTQPPGWKQALRQKATTVATVTANISSHDNSSGKQEDKCRYPVDINILRRTRYRMLTLRLS